MVLESTLRSLNESFGSLMRQQVGGNTAGDLLGVFLVFLFSFILLEIFRTVIVLRLKSLARKSRSQLDDVVFEAVSRIGRPVYFLIAVYIALQFVELNEAVSRMAGYALLVGITYYSVRIVQSVINFF